MMYGPMRQDMGIYSVPEADSGRGSQPVKVMSSPKRSIGAPPGQNAGERPYSSQRVPGSSSAGAGQGVYPSFASKSTKRASSSVSGGLRKSTPYQTRFASWILPVAQAAVGSSNTLKVMKAWNG